ncbi:hypothetical protein FHW69_002988 [Luteibacter sp. Sphag1AF]|uniref:hypothetical protein n=1 Tax=Luteibacter sp. Sphag1AF TaxID=2587031 RepID=UPI00160D50F7|nr:hypothetical protein [Luteibacter sp. Sphag1AF]MBB3228353.1 hypothetical protein [Luteibacter sp. Sphag1AF]
MRPTQTEPWRDKIRATRRRQLIGSCIFIAALLAYAYEPEANVRHNPHPSQPYEITIDLHDMTYPEDSVIAEAQFDIIDLSCIPVRGRLWNPMRIPPATKFVDIPLTKGTDGKYRGYAFFDEFMDEDYFGLGVCKWTMPFMATRISSRGISFSASVKTKPSHKESHQTTYFHRKLFDPTSAPNTILGYHTPEAFENATLSDLFQIHLDGRDASQ